MSVAILISGVIFKEPQQRTSQSGKKYVTTTVKASADNATSDFYSVLAFGDTAGAALMRLGINERVCIQGSLKIELYSANDGSQKISRTVFADHVMALRAPPKEKKPKANPASGYVDNRNHTTPSTAPTSQDQATTGAPPFDDGIPFAPEFR